MKIKLINNLLLKILSVISAVLLWLIVLNIDDPVASKDFYNVKVNLINTEAITSQNQTYRIEEGTDYVNLKVFARRRSVLSKLKPTDFEVTADMQKDLRFDNLVKIEVKYTGNYSIDHIEQSRTNVLVGIEESVTEQFKVTVRTTNKPSDGLVVGSTMPEQTLVEITGPISVVERIKKVEALVDITGITGTAVRKCSLRLLNGDGDEIDGTYLDYIGKEKEFEVTITTLNTKLVGISFDVSQAAPENYSLRAVSYKPETVTIAGLKSEISSIYNLNIPAEALNPERLTGKITQTVDISQYLPTGIVIPKEDEREIVVTMEIAAHETKDFTFQPGQIYFANIREGLALDASDMPALEVTISGLAENLEQLKMEDLSVTVDLENCRRSGTYIVPISVTAPDGYGCPNDLKLSVTLVNAAEGEE